MPTLEEIVTLLAITTDKLAVAHDKVNASLDKANIAIEKLAEENRKNTEDIRKNAEESRKRAEDIHKNAEESRKRAEDMRKNAEECRKRAEEEDRKYAEERRKRAEERRKQVAERRKHAAERRKRAEEEDRKYAEERRKRAEEEDRIYAEERRAVELKSDEEWAKLRKDLNDLNKSHRKLESFFNSQWSKLVEALVNNQVVPLLRSRGFSVNQTTQRLAGKQRDGYDFEFDIIAINGDSIVVIEVKTTLRPNDVSHFLNKLDNFRTLVPHYSGMKVYGAVAFLRHESEAAANAAKAGLFTILATGASALITNPDDFNPKEF